MNDQSAGKTRAVDLDYHNITKKPCLCCMNFQKNENNVSFSNLEPLKLFF